MENAAVTENGKARISRSTLAGLNFSLYALACYLYHYTTILRRHVNNPASR